MKIKNLLFLIISLVITFSAVGQEDKKPEAENDYATARALETIEIFVLENDFAYNEHPFEIFLVFGGLNGSVEKNDSTVLFTPNLNYRGLDSLTYSIKDLENNLISDFAKVYIDIHNDGFEYLDMNEVSCRINSFGNQFWDLGIGGLSYEVPAGSGIVSIFNEAFWIGGLDEDGYLHLAAERYRQSGADFFQGPVMDSLAYNLERDIKWNKVWKLSSSEIMYHREHWQDEGYEPVENIAQWPGSGNVDLGQAVNLAPYYDWDNDGIYNPGYGDFPLIKGNQAIYTLVNDDRNIHTESNGMKLGVEIQTLYYAYDEPSDSALKYTIFVDQKVINRSANVYHGVYAANFLDFDLGNYFDDYLHSDTLLQSLIVFNGDSVDGTGGTGEYGEHPPAQAFTCLNYEMDGSMYFFGNGAVPGMEDPEDDFEYYNYLRGYWKDSVPLTNGGTGYGGSDPARFIFTGDPVSGNGWTELNAANEPGDRRGLVISGPHQLFPDDTLHLEYALIWARDFEGDNISSVALLKDRIQNVRNMYQASLGQHEFSIVSSDLHLFPNPCGSDIFVGFKGMVPGKQLGFTIFNMMGVAVKKGEVESGETQKIDLRGMSPGIYFINIQDGKTSITKKIIKQAF